MAEKQPKAAGKKAPTKPKERAVAAPKQEKLTPEVPKPVEKPKVAEPTAKSVAKPVAATVTVAKEAPVRPPQKAVEVPKPAPKVKKAVAPKPLRAPKPKPTAVQSEASPLVKIAYAGDVRTREAKGFSYAELLAAGVTKGQALRSGLRVDSRRKSSHEQNVKLLESIKPKAA